jgi:hypothetical protein
VYLLTHFFRITVKSPSDSCILCGFISGLDSWRLFYVKFLASNRFLQNAVLICEEEQMEELVVGLENIDPITKLSVT